MDVVADSGDLAAYEEVIHYLEENDVAEPDAMDWIDARIDTRNHIDYHIAQIFLGNRDWGGNNVDLWRIRTDSPQPEANSPRDGRFRWMMADLDFSLGLGSTWWFVKTDMIRFATEEGRMEWPNPDWSTFLFRSLLRNPNYRDSFIIRFADLLNSAFLPERTLPILEAFAKRIAPEMPRQVNRWSYPESMEDWYFYLDDIAEFLERRPAYQWDHLRDFFGLGPLVEVSVHVDEASGGYTRVNSLYLRPHTAGLEVFEGGRWSGMYPTGHTIEIEAVPHPGYRFEGWLDDPGAPALRQIELTADTSMEPHFTHHPGSLPVEPHPVIEGPYTFERLPPETPPGTNPPSLRFPLSPKRDPGRETDLGGDFWVFPYNLNNRSRVVGLGEDGVAFINTANAQNLPEAGYVMGALLALDTRDVDSVHVGWTAATLRPNDREYALRLQYRVGTNGPFRDVVDTNGQPVEYTRRNKPGHTISFPPVPLPPDAVGLTYVELLWRYHDVGTFDSGPRAKLRLDNIFVTATPASRPPHPFWTVFAEIAPGTFQAPAFGVTQFAKHPWMHTENLGLLAVIEEDAGSGAFLWSETDGWLWTEPRALPYLLRLGEESEWFSPASEPIAHGWSYFPAQGEWWLRPGASN